MGRNGAGKTTMFRIAAGLLRPDYGRVAWRGTYQERPSLARLARDGLMYGAQGSTLTRFFTLREHLAALVAVHGGGDRVDEAVGTLALAPLLDHRPTRMSGGERQRASLALALVRAPACLLVDEPFAGVAPRDRPLVARGLRLLKDAGCAVVTSGHDVDDVFSVSDLVIWVTAGTSHWLGTPAEARLHHGFRRAYLGPRSLGASPASPAPGPPRRSP
jgi:ABC-type multidrug transport system ATPase subunit